MQALSPSHQTHTDTNIEKAHTERINVFFTGQGNMDYSF